MILSRVKWNVIHTIGLEFLFLYRWKKKTNGDPRDYYKWFSEKKKKKNEFSFCDEFATHIVFACAYCTQKYYYDDYNYYCLGNIPVISPLTTIWMDGFLLTRQFNKMCHTFCMVYYIFCYCCICWQIFQFEIQKKLCGKNCMYFIVVYCLLLCMRWYVFEKNGKFWKIFEMSFYISDCCRIRHSFLKHTHTLTK